MDPIKFAQSNLTYTHPECRELPAYRGEGKVISCWALTDEELELIQRTKRIFVSIAMIGPDGQPLQPPIYPSVHSPFIDTFMHSIQDRRHFIIERAAMHTGNNFEKALSGMADNLEKMAKTMRERVETPGFNGQEINYEICESIADVGIIIEVLKRLYSHSTVTAKENNILAKIESDLQ
jgi:hypothetical protein